MGGKLEEVVSAERPPQGVTEAQAETATESAEPILRLRGIGRRFGGLDAVRELDLEVRPRRRAILGPNGAGRRRSST